MASPPDTKSVSSQAHGAIGDVLSAAVVGLGGISHEHLSFLAGKTSAGSIDDVARLRAVCDLSSAAGRYAASTFGPATAYTDLGELLETVKPDVVHVLTPPASHPPLVTACLEAGANVICEKPITASAAELEVLLSTAERTERALTESHNYRFNPGVERIRQSIDEGDLGTIREVEIRISLPVTDPSGRFGDPNLPSPIHRMPAGVIHDFITHFAYLLLHLSPGVEYHDVSAAWNRHGDNELFTFDDLDARLIGEGPDGAVHGRLRFDARSAPDTFSIVVRGAVGFAETDLFQPYLRLVKPRAGGGKLSPIANQLANGTTLVRSGIANLGQKLLQQGPYVGLHRMLDATYRALAAGQELPVSPADMRASSTLIDRLLAERPTT